MLNCITTYRNSPPPPRKKCMHYVAAGNDRLVLKQSMQTLSPGNSSTLICTASVASSRSVCMLVLWYIVIASVIFSSVSAVTYQRQGNQEHRSQITDHRSQITDHRSQRFIFFAETVRCCTLQTLLALNRPKGSYRCRKRSNQLR